jgi:hypothetical protein
MVVGDHQPCEWLDVRRSAGELSPAKEKVQHRLRWRQQDRFDFLHECTNASEMLGSVAAIFANGTGGGINGRSAAVADIISEEVMADTNIEIVVRPNDRPTVANLCQFYQELRSLSHEMVDDEQGRHAFQIGETSDEILCGHHPEPVGSKPQAEPKFGRPH